MSASRSHEETPEPPNQPDLDLEQFESIWSLQSHLLSEADRNDTAIVTNDDLEKAVRQVIMTINRELSKQIDQLVVENETRSKEDGSKEQIIKRIDKMLEKFGELQI